MYSFDFQVFFDELQATKPPYKCPFKACEKIYRTFSGIQYHVLNYHNNDSSNNLTTTFNSSDSIRLGGALDQAKSSDQLTDENILELLINGQNFNLSTFTKLKIEHLEEGEENKNICKNLTNCSKGNEEDVLRDVVQSSVPQPEFEVIGEDENENPVFNFPPEYINNDYDEKTIENIEWDGNKTKEPAFTEHLLSYCMDLEDKIWLETQYKLMEQEKFLKNEKPLLIGENEFEEIIDSIEKNSHFVPENVKTSIDRGVDDSALCSVCCDGNTHSNNTILFCDLCNLAVHQDCYGVPYVPEGIWLCRPCLLSPSVKVQCCLCPKAGGALKQATDGRWVHVLCAAWVPEVHFANPVFLEPIESLETVPPARWKLACILCRQKKVGACIQCHKPNCYTSFHVSCAIYANFHLSMIPRNFENQSKFSNANHSIGSSPSTNSSIFLPSHLLGNVKKVAYCDIHTAEKELVLKNSDTSEQDDEKKSNISLQNKKKINYNKNKCKNKYNKYKKSTYKNIDDNSEIGEEEEEEEEEEFLSKLKLDEIVKQRGFIGKNVVSWLKKSHHFTSLPYISHDQVIKIISSALKLGEDEEEDKRLKIWSQRIRNYWMMKRQTRNGCPLLKHLSPSIASFQLVNNLKINNQEENDSEKDYRSLEDPEDFCEGGGRMKRKRKVILDEDSTEEEKEEEADGEENDLILNRSKRSKGEDKENHSKRRKNFIISSDEEDIENKKNKFTFNQNISLKQKRLGGNRRQRNFSRFKFYSEVPTQSLSTNIFFGGEEMGKNLKKKDENMKLIEKEENQEKDCSLSLDGSSESRRSQRTRRLSSVLIDFTYYSSTRKTNNKNNSSREDTSQEVSSSSLDLSNKSGFKSMNLLKGDNKLELEKEKNIFSAFASLTNDFVSEKSTKKEKNLEEENVCYDYNLSENNEKIHERLKNEMETLKKILLLVKEREEIKLEKLKVDRKLMTLIYDPVTVLLTKILKLLQMKDQYNFFSDPVDPSQVPDYLQIIKNPMSFSVMRQKIHSCQYSSLFQFEEDFNLIIENCITYNATNTIYYKAALKLKAAAGWIFKQANVIEEEILKKTKDIKKLKLSMVSLHENRIFSPNSNESSNDSSDFFSLPSTNKTTTTSQGKLVVRVSPIMASHLNFSTPPSSSRSQEDSTETKTSDESLLNKEHKNKTSILNYFQKVSKSTTLIPNPSLSSIFIKPTNSLVSTDSLIPSSTCSSYFVNNLKNETFNHNLLTKNIESNSNSHFPIHPFNEKDPEKTILLNEEEVFYSKDKEKLEKKMDGVNILIKTNCEDKTENKLKRHSNKNQSLVFDFRSCINKKNLEPDK